MSSDKSPSPEESFRNGIKAAVGAVNNGLARLDQATAGVRKPVVGAVETAKDQSVSLAQSTKYTYQRRHEFAPEIIGTSTVLGGGLAAIRRGRIAGVLGAVIAGGAAYAVVYDEISLESIPDAIFGKK